MGRRWTDDDQRQMIDMHCRDIPTREIARELRRTPAAIRSRRRAYDMDAPTWASARKPAAYEQERNPDGSISIRISSGHWIRVDASDAERVIGRRWRPHYDSRWGTVYVETCVRRPDGAFINRSLGRFISRAGTTHYVRHLNGDPFDARRCNLKVVAFNDPKAETFSTEGGGYDRH